MKNKNSPDAIEKKKKIEKLEDIIGADLQNSQKYLIDNNINFSCNHRHTNRDENKKYIVIFVEGNIVTGYQE